jgi:hypothetical protein
MLDTAYPMPVGDAENECREFAAEFPTANVLRGIALAEAGTISWIALSAVFARGLRAGLDAVQ